MDHAIDGFDVSFHDLGVVNFHTRGTRFDVEFLAVDGFGFHRFHIGSHDFSRHDVIGENRGELRFVLGFQKIFQSSLGKLREGFVSRREDRERSGALQRFDQASRFDGGDKGVEAAGGRSDGDDVFIFGFGARDSGKGGERDKCCDGETA